MSVMHRIPFEDVSAASHRIWSDKLIAAEIAKEAIEIISFASRKKFTFFNGKSFKYIVGGLFYLLGYRYNAVKRQRVLAEHLCTTEVTIRASYKQWLATFPEVFVDIFVKIPAEDKLRFVGF